MKMKKKRENPSKDVNKRFKRTNKLLVNELLAIEKIANNIQMFFRSHFPCIYN